MAVDDERGVLASSRRQAVVALLRESGEVSVTELHERFAVSRMTARRDLDALVRDGAARRTHGGAVLPTTAADALTAWRERDGGGDPALADAALAMIGDCGTLFLDASATSLLVARAIAEQGRRLTVVTNGLRAMHVLADGAGHGPTLVGIGGTLSPRTVSWVGPHALHAVRGRFTDWALVGAAGVGADGALLAPDAAEAEIRRAMLAQSGNAAVLVEGHALKGHPIGRPGSAQVLLGGHRSAELQRLRMVGVRAAVVDQAPASSAAGRP